MEAGGSDRCERRVTDASVEWQARAWSGRCERGVTAGTWSGRCERVVTAGTWSGWQERGVTGKSVKMMEER